MSPLYCYVVFFLLLFPTSAFAADTVLVTLRLVKTTGAPADLSVKVEFPSDCKSCQIVDDPDYARQNEREVILAMRLPRSTAIDMSLHTQAHAFRRVILETTDLSFSEDSDGLRFTVPSQVADRPNSGEFQTHLYWPGVELRLEHGDIKRRAGDYAAGTFPSLQRQAASNLEFGLLEAVRRLGLDHYVDDQNLGRLFIMGFDTNYPHGHHDFPPHFHLALWLPNYRGGGSLIPHFYLTSQGLIANSLVMPYDWPLKTSEYKANEFFTVTDMLARPVYSLVINPNGGLRLVRFDGPSCVLEPISSGFDVGAKVKCPTFPDLAIKVSDDVDAGEIQEWINGRVAQTFRYDPDTGAVR